MIRVEFLGPMSDLPPKEINAQTLQELKMNFCVMKNPKMAAY